MMSNYSPYSEQPLVQAQKIKIGLQDGPRSICLVESISFDLIKGKTLALVGESGSGKTLSALCLLGLLPKNGPQLLGGSIVYRGEKLERACERTWRQIRGKHIAFIPQAIMNALNPTLCIGLQMIQTVRAHQSVTQKEAMSLIAKMLDRLSLHNMHNRLNLYPHELSGGMRQRILIAMALINRPQVVIADEPTTALDITIQEQILQELKQVQHEEGMALLFITHDLTIVPKIAHQVAVMEKGRIVENTSVKYLFSNPQHPYSQSLIASIPSIPTSFLTPLQQENESLHALTPI